MSDHNHWPGTIAGVTVSGVWATITDLPWGYMISLLGMTMAALGPPLVKLAKDAAVAWEQYKADRDRIRGGGPAR